MSGRGTKRKANEMGGDRKPNILLIGATGAGKSSFCEMAKASHGPDSVAALRGQLAEDIAAGGHSGVMTEVTKYPCLSEHESPLAGYTLIDTPGLPDASGDDQETIDKMLVRLKRETQIDHVVLLCRAGRLTGVEFRVFNDLLGFLGQTNSNNIAILFTLKWAEDTGQWDSRVQKLQRLYGKGLSVLRFAKDKEDAEVKFKSVCEEITTQVANIDPKNLVRVKTKETLVAELKTELDKAKLRQKNTEEELSSLEAAVKQFNEAVDDLKLQQLQVQLELSAYELERLSSALEAVSFSTRKGFVRSQANRNSSPAGTHRLAWYENNALNFIEYGPSAQDGKGFVYQYQVKGAADESKIGFTKDLPQKRIAVQLRKNNHELVLSKSHDCVYHKLLETAVHRLLRMVRMADRGGDGGTEWFAVNSAEADKAIVWCRRHINVMYGI
jgi:hypothetical protein